ncbi:L-2-aminoadipate N-acetyltransferase [Corynebacterium mycetoides]|uniref:L-2-aminoadipate N-acetyltransferase n=1 Tax=Corynebacterium mycetoides TaxID=38302 RepID=A0A1G9LQK9_9CORY|nr:hypothetical protein [Corynebacterium mycetoides]SDL63765.1 L-2-aminoadipate N-acetyltransferase [Corynebacterium mycetoides]
MLSRIDEQPNPHHPLIVVLGDNIDDEDHDLLFPALRARGISVVRIHPHELTVEMDDTAIRFSAAGLELNPALVLGWVLDDLLPIGMSHLDAFAAAGIPVINDALTLFRAQSKYVCSAHLAARGIAGYPAITGREADILETWLRELDAAAVMKPLSGFGGEGLTLISSPADAREVVDKHAHAPASFYAVPYIDNPGRDIRVNTINHRAIFAMYRYAPEGGWITNVRAGGGIAMCPLTPDIAALAEQASRALGTLIGGIDIGENTRTGGLVVYEVNSCPTIEPPVIEQAADFLAAATRDLDSALRTWQPSKIYDTLDEDPALFHLSKRAKLRK